MDDYISQEAAIAEIKADAGCANCCVKMLGYCLTCTAGRKIRRVEEIRPADVLPVVYCKDCIYDDNCFAQSIFEEMSRIPFDKNRFFCADGKRREGGTP